MIMERNRARSPHDPMWKLIAGNELYLHTLTNPADISQGRREETALGQKPYAVILTCSDSRVVPEHIFSAGIGELFVVRTAGNVVGDFEVGSIEYGVDYLGARLIVVMGHSDCGAVAAALSDKEFTGYVESVVHEIRLGLDDATDECDAVQNNILHSKKRVMQSKSIRNAVRRRNVDIVCAKYYIKSGKVEFFEC